MHYQENRWPKIIIILYDVYNRYIDRVMGNCKLDRLVWLEQRDLWGMMYNEFEETTEMAEVRRM